MNNNYKNRYERLINTVKSKGDRDLQGYTETHHIILRCMGGSDNPDNLVRLTLREHFLAHWLLWKTYPKHLGIVSSFLQMNNKNPNTDKGFQGRITSRTYETLKTNAYMLISENHRGKVHVRGEDGETITMSKEEYYTQDKYKFHTTGKIYVLDTHTDSWVYITSALYQSDKARYKSRMSLDGFPYGGAHSSGGGSNGAHIKSCKYPFIDVETDEVIKITKTEARSKNKEYGYKRLKNVQKKNVKCIDEAGNEYYVKQEEYDRDIHLVHNKNIFVVMDTVTNERILISKTEYDKEPTRYLTTTKGKVLAKDAEGNRVVVTKEEFSSGKYTGQTSGLTTVFHKELKKYVQITDEEFRENKELYEGPTKDKVNVINKITGERKQIPRDLFDREIYSSLGSLNKLFLCRNKLTKKEKMINIYEWHLVCAHYDIIDNEKFEKAKNSI